MTMTGDGLFAAVKAALPAATDTAIPEAHLKPLCTAIVAYIKANAVVAVPATGLVSAAPSSPVTGAATGTIS